MYLSGAIDALDGRVDGDTCRALRHDHRPNCEEAVGVRVEVRDDVAAVCYVSCQIHRYARGRLCKRSIV